MQDYSSGFIDNADGFQAVGRRRFAARELLRSADRLDLQEVLDYGSRQPASGIMVFHWSGITKQWEKVEALRRAYLSYRPT